MTGFRLASMKRGGATVAIAVSVVGQTLVLASASRGATASASVERGVAVDTRAPDFSITGADGTKHHLAALAGKKNLVLIFFRGVW